MKKNATRQYTIRNIPDQIDSALRRRAKLTGKSFNQVAVEALAAGAGESNLAKRDLTFLIGSMGDQEAERMESEIGTQRRVDAELWK